MHLVMLHISRLSSLHNIKCSLKCALHYITKDGQNCKNTVIRRAILPKSKPVFRRATWAHWFCNHHENWTGKSPQGPDSAVDGDLFIPPRQRKNPVSDEWEGSPRSTWAPTLTKGVSEEEWLPHQTLIPPQVCRTLCTCQGRWADLRQLWRHQDCSGLWRRRCHWWSTRRGSCLPGGGELRVRWHERLSRCSSAVPTLKRSHAKYLARLSDYAVQASLSVAMLITLLLFFSVSMGTL